MPQLKKLYKKILKREKIPVALPSSKKITLSPGKHNELQMIIIREFSSRFIGKSGVILYMGDTALKAETKVESL